MDKDTQANSINMSEKLAQTKLYYDFFQNIQVFKEIMNLILFC